jgi:8-oxo-dGTP diphosphatase
MSGECPRLGSAVLVIDGDRILLGKRNKEPLRGYWVIPGGGVRWGESIRDAAKREYLEETGLEIEVLDPIRVYEIIKPPLEHRVIIYSWGRVVRGELMPSSDLSEVRFCTREELSKLNFTDTVRRVLEDVEWL